MGGIGARRQRTDLLPVVSYNVRREKTGIFNRETREN
jgi:hypothetical protein